MSTDTETLHAVAHQLLAHCVKGEYIPAIEALYADNAKHVEAYEMGPDMPRVTEGKPAILKSAHWWEENHEVHESETKGPYPHGEDRFALWMMLDVTPKAGPMAGQRMQMQEVCLYTVADGKITQVDFMWDPASCN